jgi:transposase
MTLVVMSDKEFERVGIIREVSVGSLSIDAAALALGLSRRQIFRLLRAFQADGPAGLASRRRGRPSNRRYDPALRDQALSLVRGRYAGFGPTLAAEKLSEVHGLALSRETLRQWMLAEGLWADRKARQQAVHQPRARRDCPGELVQIDGSRHWWFEDRGPPCTLLVYIDDATGRLMHLKFVEAESTFDYMLATREYLQAHGKPLALYSDKHTVFRVAKIDAVSGDGMTQFGRAMHELGITILCANSPQAKGRVERANKTLQDRLVKELRLSGAATITEGNALLPAFMADYNKRFARAPTTTRTCTERCRRPTTSPNSWSAEKSEQCRRA